METTTMQDVALEHQISEARQAKDELTRLQTLADSLPILERQKESVEIDRRVRGQLDRALAHVTETLESEGIMLSHLKAQIAQMIADLSEVIELMRTSQGHIADCASELARVVQVQAGAKHRSRLSVKDRAERAHAMGDLTIELQRTWARLWSECGGLSPDLLAFPPGTSKNRLAHDLMILIVKHVGRPVYHPGHVTDISPFERKTW
jgi:uncharacterized protein YicC (UPF0701 family)